MCGDYGGLQRLLIFVMCFLAPGVVGAQVSFMSRQRERLSFLSQWNRAEYCPMLVSFRARKKEKRNSKPVKFNLISTFCCIVLLGGNANGETIGFAGS